MYQITTYFYTCLINWGVNSNYNSTVIIAILFKWFSALKYVFHTDIFFTFSKIGMYGLLYILTYSLEEYWYRDKLQTSKPSVIYI